MILICIEFKDYVGHRSYVKFLLQIAYSKPLELDIHSIQIIVNLSQLMLSRYVTYILNSFVKKKIKYLSEEAADHDTLARAITHMNLDARLHYYWILCK